MLGSNHSLPPPHYELSTTTIEIPERDRRYDEVVKFMLLGISTLEYIIIG